MKTRTKIGLKLQAYKCKIQCKIIDILLSCLKKLGYRHPITYLDYSFNDILRINNIEEYKFEQHFDSYDLIKIAMENCFDIQSKDEAIKHAKYTFIKGCANSIYELCFDNCEEFNDLYHDEYILRVKFYIKKNNRLC